MSEAEDDPAAMEAAEPTENASRRDFLDEIALASLGITGLGSAVVLIRYLSPNALFEPPTRFRAGMPDLYPVNSVTYIPDQQVYIVRSPQGLWALSAICTHLGCIPGYKPKPGSISPSWPGGYLCPCHGSKYDLAGRVYQNVPAPMNLPVPPYSFKGATTLVLGKNPKGSTFTLSEVATM